MFSLAKLYCRIVVKVPWVFLLLVTACAVAMGLVAYYTNDLPDFSEPLKGFEPRGTEICGHSFAISHLNDMYGGGYKPIQHNTDKHAEHKRKKRSEEESSREQRSLANGCFIGQPDTHMVKIVFEASEKNRNLYTVDALKSMCNTAKKIMDASSFTQACPPFSIGEVIADIRGKQTCDDLTEEDLKQTLKHMKQCKNITDFSTEKDSFQEHSRDQYCSGPLYIIQHFLADTGFLTSPNNFLTYAMVIPHISFSAGAQRLQDFYYSEFKGKDYDDGVVKITGLDLNIREEVMETILLDDVVLFLVGMGLIFVVMFLYLRSIFIAIATVLNVIFSAVSAYFFFMNVLQIPFFSFLNVLGVLILIAVGADDVFVFYDIWQEVGHTQSELDMVERLRKTLHHAFLSITVTSLTTAASFFSNSVNSITSIKSFGIFCGVAILFNLVYMLLWVPPFVIFCEKIWLAFQAKCIPRCCPGNYDEDSLEHRPIFIQRKWNDFQNCMRKISIKIFGQFIPFLVLKAWFVWIVVLLGLGIGGVIIVWVTPKLELPHDKDFKMFVKSHPFARYMQVHKYHFQFLIDKEKQMLGSVYMSTVWGVSGVDNGNVLNPDDHGHLMFDPTFDLSAPNSQTWMQMYCEAFKNQSFVSKHTKLLPCSMTKLKEIVESTNCSKMFGQSHIECCGRFPLNQSVFDSCINVAIKRYSVGLYFGAMLGMPLFDKTNHITGYIIRQWQTNHTFSKNYQVMDAIYNEMVEFQKDQLRMAPPGVRDGWMGSGYFFMYDLQRALSHGTYTSIIVSLSVAFSVMLITARNVLLTIYAIVTIMLTIFVTVASFVLMGWELGIVECITISLAVGLSIDFSIHYGVAYRANDEVDKKPRVQKAFSTIGSAVFMAAATTFLAGSAIMPSEIRSYNQLGMFLMVVMAISWVYATFFFQSLCCVVGPKGNFCQIPSLCSLFESCCKRDSGYELPLDLQNVADADTLSIESDVSLIDPGNAYGELVIDEEDDTYGDEAPDEVRLIDNTRSRSSRQSAARAAIV